jgi:hypothetical protein
MEGIRDRLQNKFNPAAVKEGALGPLHDQKRVTVTRLPAVKTPLQINDSSQTASGEDSSSNK